MQNMNVASAIQEHPYIDQSALPLLTSPEYLRNYTYLEYCMFPELFTFYIHQLNYSELTSLFDSYIQTLNEFFLQGANYSLSFQGVLGNQYFIQKLQKRLNLITVQNRIRGITSNSQQNQNIQKNLQHLIRKVENSRQAYLQGYAINQNLLENLKTIMNFFHQEYVLKEILERLNRDPIAKPLFNLICIFVEHLASSDNHSILNAHFASKYLIYAALESISRAKIQKFISWNQENQFSSESLLEILKLRMIPMEMELSEFWRVIKRAETKDSLLNGLISGAFGNTEIYLQVFRLIRAVKKLFQDIKSQKINDGNSQTISINQIVTFIEKSIEGYGTEEEKTSLTEEEKTSLTDKKNSNLTKELTVQNVEKIARLLSKVTFINTDQSKVTFINTNQKFLANPVNIHQGEKVNYFEQSIDVKKHFDHDFLLNYKELSELTLTIQDQTSFDYQQTTSELLSDVSNLLLNLFQQNNQSLTSLIRLSFQSHKSINLKAETLTYQSHMLIQIMNTIDEKITSILSLSHKNNTKNQQFQHVLAFKEKLLKTKNSLLTNILSLKVLLQTFKANQISSQKLENSIVEEKNEELQAPVSIIEHIDELFCQIIHFSVESTQNFSSKTLSKAFSGTLSSFTQFNSQLLANQQEIKTLPYLESILLMFGSIQLWNQFKKNSSQNIKICQFMENVVKQYSQQKIKIDSHEIMFVERILISLQTYKEVNSNAEVAKVDEYLGKLLTLKNTKGVNTADLVNSEDSLYALLELLSLKLIAKNFHEKNDGFFKIPFWKVVTLSQTKDNLKSEEIAQFILEKLIEHGKRIFVRLQTQKSQVINVQSGSFKNLSSLVMKSQGSTVEFFEIFNELRTKYLKLLEFKGLASEGNASENSEETLLRKEKEQLTVFRLSLVEKMFVSMTRIKKINLLMSSYTGSNSSLEQLTFNQLQQLIIDLNLSAQNLINEFSSLVLEPKLTLIKASNQQLSQVLFKANLKNSAENTEKLGEKVTQLQKLYNFYVDFGIFMLAFLSWIKTEALSKFQMLQVNNKALLNKKKHKKFEKSTEMLIQAITLLSLCTGQHFNVNFEALESYLESNIQPTAKPKQDTLMSQHVFPNIELQNNEAIKIHLNHMGSFEFIEFMYEFIPFDIKSEEEEGVLFNMSMDYAINHENHQFLNQQKTEKIKLSRTISYLEFLHQNLQKKNQSKI